MSFDLCLMESQPPVPPPFHLRGPHCSPAHGLSSPFKDWLSCFWFTVGTSPMPTAPTPTPGGKPFDGHGRHWTHFVVCVFLCSAAAKMEELIQKYKLFSVSLKKRLEEGFDLEVAL